MKKAVLFDLDGTLWHTCDVILPVWNDILKKHKETTKQITLEEMNSYCLLYTSPSPRDCS